MRAVILGMGNPILSDDGVGVHMARALGEKLPGVDVRTADMIGLHLLDLVAGYDAVLVIDAIQTGTKPPGTVEEVRQGERCLHLFSSHGFHFFEILQLGRDLGYPMPEAVGIAGIEIGNDCPFGEGLSKGLLDRKEDILREIIHLGTRWFASIDIRQGGKDAFRRPPGETAGMPTASH